MSQTVNIRRDVKDAFYRYKMPRIQSKIEGKGNGIKTVVANMTDVAKALNRPPTYVTKFFGNELGAIVHCDDKTGRYIVNGAHDADKLASLLDAFITKFVLCTSCDNPETDLSVTKDGTIWRQCKACGHRSTVDMGHKLVTFIQKNPPRPPRKAAEKTDQADGNDSGVGEQIDSQQEEGMTAPEGLEDEFAGLTGDSKFAKDDWADAEAVREAELSGLSAAVKGSLNIPEQDPVKVFAEWLEAEERNDNEEIISKVKETNVQSDKAIAILTQVLLNPTANQSFSGIFNSHLPLFSSLIAAAKEQRAFLGGLERQLGLHRPDLLKFLPAALQAAYAADIIDEEAVRDWHARPSRRYMSDATIAAKVRTTAQPFIDWLDADSDSDRSE